MAAFTRAMPFSRERHAPEEPETNGPKLLVFRRT
jgi:hypothetical protein